MKLTTSASPLASRRKAQVQRGRHAAMAAFRACEGTPAGPAGRRDLNAFLSGNRPQAIKQWKDTPTGRTPGLPKPLHIIVGGQTAYFRPASDYGDGARYEASGGATAKANNAAAQEPAYGVYEDGHAPTPGAAGSGSGNPPPATPAPLVFTPMHTATVVTFAGPPALPTDDQQVESCTAAERHDVANVNDDTPALLPGASSSRRFRTVAELKAAKAKPPKG